jgi:hypothetical protein
MSTFQNRSNFNFFGKIGFKNVQISNLFKILIYWDTFRKLENPYRKPARQVEKPVKTWQKTGYIGWAWPRRETRGLRH